MKLLALMLAYQACGLHFQLSIPFMQPAPIGSGAVSLTCPDAAHPRMELILHRTKAAPGPADLLLYEKSTFLGVAKPAEWSSTSTILGHSVEVGGQLTSTGSVQCCLVPLSGGEQLFLALRASREAPKGEPEAVWNDVSSTLRN